MKKLFIMLSGILFPLVSFAQEGPDVIFKEEMYALKISPNGEYIGNVASNANIYVLETGEQFRYADTYLGGGNAIADNGMAVGSGADKAVVMLNGKIIRQENYQKYWYGSFEGITKDGSKVVGFVGNSGKGVSYLPIYAEVDADGNVSDPVILPYPDKDFFNGTPQFVSAIWISDDGNIIGGQVQDSMGYYAYPIVYKKDASGNWKYDLPTKDLFNPTGIEIPENPWEIEPPYPEPEDFMSGALLQAYQEAYQAYLNNPIVNKEPVPEEYMTEEQYNKYAEAVVEYNEWFYGQQDAIRKYINAYNEVLATSPTFALNDFAQRYDGAVMAQLGGVINSNNRMEGKIFVFDNINNTITATLDVPKANAAPKQILPDGTIIVATPIDENPSSWLLKPNETEFVTVPEFLQTKYPELADYVEKNFANGYGVLSSSYDMSVMTGGLFVTCLSDYNEDMDASYFYSYIFTGLEFAGIDSIVADEPVDGVYRVYNLKGVKVLETKNADELNSLAKGLYIINGKKVIVK